MALPVALTAQAAQSLAPGIANAAGAFPAFRGGLGGSSMFSIDGIATRDGLTRQNSENGFMIRDLMESVQVVQSPLNSRYGNTSGGLTNLVTKSGGNNFSGSFRANISRPEWSASRNNPLRYPRFNRTAPYNQPNKPPLNNVSTVSHDDLSKDYMATIRGPIIKDHLTFSYGRTWQPVTTATSSARNLAASGIYGYYITSLLDASSPAVLSYDWGFEPNQQSKSRFVKGRENVVDQFKLYYIINPNHQIEVNYTQQDDDSPYTWASGLEETWEERTVTKRRMMGLDYTGLVLNGVLNLKLGRSKRTYVFPSGPGDPIDYSTWSYLATHIGASNSNTLYDVYRINGTFGSSPEEAQNDNYSLNYSKTIDNHNLDIGIERLQEKVMINPYTGPNNKYFYSPGMTENMEFMVWNWFESPFVAPGWAEANLTVYNRMSGRGNPIVPHLYSVQLLEGVDYHAYNTSDSIYINDLWHINQNWTVMAGLRYDNWKVENYKGTELDTSAVSPRLEVKYDIRGDNRQLLTLSYAHFRGTIGFPTLGPYGRRPTDIKVLNYWSKGDPGVMYPVSRAEFLNESNYSVFRVLDETFDTKINPNIKPDVAKQWEFAYRRSFEKGGFMRASFVYRDYDDLLYRRGTDEVVWDTADAINPASRLLNYLDLDPYNERKYYGLEIEFELPLYTSAESRVTANGSWTSCRSYERAAWGDTLNTAGIRWDDIYQTNGFNIDDYNPYGEGPRSIHNTFNMWVTWNYGRPGQVRSIIAVLGNYTTSSPTSLTFSEYLPGMNATYPGTQILPSTGNSPSSLSHIIGKKGQFVGQDSYSMNMKWTLNIPIPTKLGFFKNLVGFTELTINNVPKWQTLGGASRSNDSTVRSRVAANYHTGYSTAAANNNFTAMSEYGVQSYSGSRSFAFSAGLRF
jgi:outer membrane receptor protein involved in Fe transport